MSVVLGLDTATAATAVAVLGDGISRELRDDAGPRPRHAETLLPLIERALDGIGWAAVTRICVGIGPGGFTGLRLGIATARALAQGRGLPIVGVSSLEALAAKAQSDPAAGDDGPRRSGADSPLVLAAIDARRGELFAAGYRGGTPVFDPVAIAPAALIDRLSTPALAVGDGAVRFRAELERAGVTVPSDDSPVHRVSALSVCFLGRAREPIDRDALLPDYRREPDAVPPKL